MALKATNESQLEYGPAYAQRDGRPRNIGGAIC